MFHPNQQIGPYTLVREIGRGGFAVVWLAEHRTKIVTTQVAAKLPRHDSINLGEFLKDAKVWAEVGEHRNVLRLVTADIFSGQVLIASQYASEGTLLKWLNDRGGRAPSVDSAIQMIKGILKGLSHIHSKNIVHRDLKPANVLLQGDEPLIADFGLARVLLTESSTNQIAGTFAYMAPEVWAKNDRCFQADLWAVGIILYEMLSGSRPFIGASQREFERAIREDAIPPLPEYVPQAIQLIVDKALQKKKDQRYQSAEEMLQALASVGAWHPGVPEVIPDIVASSRDVLLGVTVDLSGSMQSSINNRDATKVSRLEAFRGSLERMIATAEERLCNHSQTEAEKQTRLDAFVYGFGLRLLPHCDLLALLQVIESGEVKRAVESIKSQVVRKAKEQYSDYNGLANLARSWGFGGVVDAAVASAETRVREQVFGELRPLLERRLKEVGDVTVGLPDLACRWRSSGTSLKEAEEALFGDTPMCSALRDVVKRFEREVAGRRGVMPILFLLSDGEATDGNPVSLGAALKEVNVTVVSCFVGGRDTANPRILYGNEQSGWDRGAKQMFQLASPVPSDSAFSKFLLERKWEIQPGGRLFVQANHSDVLEEFMNVVLSPLGSGSSSALAPRGR